MTNSEVSIFLKFIVENIFWNLKDGYTSTYPISVEYDIALIKLDKPVTFSKYVQPACLGINEPKEGVKVFVSGWGITEDKEKSDILKGVQVTVYPWEKCTAMYRKPDPVEGATSNITTRMICTLDTSKDACQGDSGGILHNYFIVHS